MNRSTKPTLWGFRMETRWRRKKDVSSSLLRKTPKSQLTAEQLSTKKCCTLTKKIPYIQRQRRKSIIMMVGGHGCDKIQSQAHCGGWGGVQAKDWKIIISQKFSHRSESSESHIRPPRLMVSLQGWSLQNVWLWRPAVFDLRTSTNWGKKKLHSWRVHTRSMCTGNQWKKHWFHKSLGQTYVLVLEGLLQWRLEAAVAH